MPNKELQRLNLFDIYSKNLLHFCPTLPRPAFMCPICKRGFHQEGVIDQSPAKDGSGLLVNLAHSYPEASGGELVTLTCKKCNTRMGTKFEPHLINEHKLALALDPATSDVFPAKVAFPEGNIAAKISRIGDNYHYKLIDKSNPYAFPKIVHQLKNPPPTGVKATVVINIDRDRAAVARLHTAFLMMFGQFGYEYALSPMAEDIRKILEDEEPRKVGLPFMEVSKSFGHPKLLFTVGIVSQPSEYRCFYAMLPSPDPSKLGRCILMPGPEAAGEAAMQALMSHGKQEVTVNFTQISGDMPRRLTSRAYRQALRFQWSEQPLDLMVTIEVLLAVNDAARGNLGIPIEMTTVSQMLGVDLDETVKFADFCIRENWVTSTSGPLAQAKLFLTAKGRQTAVDMIAIAS